MSKLDLEFKVFSYGNLTNKDGSVRQTIVAFHRRKSVGVFNMNIVSQGKNSIHVRDGYRRKGVATSLYDKARELGANIEVHNPLTKDGRAFRAAYDKRMEKQDGS